MRIEKIELRRIKMPYLAPFETSFGVDTDNLSIIVRVEADGAVGWGESPLSAGPFYNEETSTAGWVVANEVLAPMLLGADLEAPEDVDRLFAPVRGNKITRAGLEFAVWDLFASMRGQSLAQALGGTRERVPVGVSVGVQASVPALLEVVGGYVAAGYRRVKLKIKPGWDVEPVRAVRERWPDLALQVDANSIYTLADADHLARLDDFGLLLIEQPLAHDDIVDHAKLQRRLQTPVCLDESITSPEHARWAVELGACRVINIKPSRLGGLEAARQVHDICRAAGLPVWCGGMLESGVGRAANVALASLPNFSLAGDISASSRYFARDIVANPFALNPDSTLSVPAGPGAGAEVDEEYLAAVTLQRQEHAA